MYGFQRKITFWWIWLLIKAYGGIKRSVHPGKI